MKQLFYRMFLEKTLDTRLQFLRYLFVGGFAAVVNIGSLYVFTDIFNVYYIISNIISFILGLIVNYFLTKFLVFNIQQNINRAMEFFVYAIIGILGLGLDTLFMWSFTSKVGMYYMLSKIISTGIVFVWNFGARKIMYVIIDKRGGIINE